MTEEELKYRGFREHTSGLWVSDEGEVFVPKSGKHPEHFTFGCKNNKSGYMEVRRNGKNYKVHRLVAECFIPNPENKPFVDHIRTVKTENSASGLRWVSHKENQNNPLSIENMRNTQKNKAVLQYTLYGELVREWPSTAECGRNGFTRQSVGKCCNGKLKIHRGFIWRYKESEIA